MRDWVFGGPRVLDFVCRVDDLVLGSWAIGFSAHGQGMLREDGSVLAMVIRSRYVHVIERRHVCNFDCGDRGFQ